MTKERLDLMIDGNVKRMLKTVAANEGLSMSQLVELMLMEHLSGEPEQGDPMWAVSDMLWIQRLQNEFSAAMKAGAIYSFETYGGLDDGYRRDCTAEPILYVGRDQGRFHKDEIVLDYLVDELHNDIISTYDSVLRTMSVRIGWAEGEDGSLVPYDLRFYAKGSAERSSDSVFDWDCGTEWSGRTAADDE